MSETTILWDILKKVGNLAQVRLFRNNTGVGWAGQAVRVPNSANVVVKNARPLHAGLIEGSSDLIGWKSITVTPDMVGKKIAVFAAVEVKTSTGRATDQQMTFINNVIKAGGIAGIARNSQEAIELFS